MKLILISLGTSWRPKASSRACRAQHLLIVSYKKKCIINTPLYLHAQSNHPPSILRNIPLCVVEICVSNKIVTKKFFWLPRKFMIIPWQSLATLTISNTIQTPTLEETEVQPGPEEGRLFILILTWDNCVHSQIWRDFLTLVDRCFQQGHKLRRICNRNRVKVTYSTMPSME